MTDASTSAPISVLDATHDLALLRAFEPIIRYNEGELFFPAAVEGYLAECNLLQGTSERDRKVVSCREARSPRTSSPPGSRRRAPRSTCATSRSR